MTGVARIAAAFLCIAPTAVAEDYVFAPPLCAEPTGRDAASLLRCHAPVFVLEQGERSYNRIGTPEIRSERGEEKVRVNPDVPAVFTEARRDRIGGKDVLHLLYRVHFTRLAFKPSVFFEMHKNVGVLAIVTLREPELAPIFFTTVYTCGCYRVLLPTDLLSIAALPPGWPRDRKKFYGALLPAALKAPEPPRSRFVLHLASKTHRTTSLETLAAAPAGKHVELPLRPMEDLRQLPVPGRPGVTGSLFYTSGPLKGHVRGAWSPIEGLTAGIFLLDLTLGMDKDFGDPEVTGTPFYTSLLPWRRDVSRLDRFDPLLRHLKFRLGS